MGCGTQGQSSTQQLKPQWRAGVYAQTAWYTRIAPREVLERLYTAGGRGGLPPPPPWTPPPPPPPPPPLPMFEADSQSFQRLRCQEDLRFKMFGPPSAGDHRGTLGGRGGSQPNPPPPSEPPRHLLIHPWLAPSGGDRVYPKNGNYCVQLYPKLQKVRTRLAPEAWAAVGVLSAIMPPGGPAYGSHPLGEIR